MNESQHSNTSINASVTCSSRGMDLIFVETFIYIILGLIAFVGNSLVCIAICRNSSLRTITNNFILSLALTDLLLTVFVLPMKTTSSVANRWIAGDFGCIIDGFSGYILLGISSLTLMLAVNKYSLVVRPNSYRRVTRRNALTQCYSWYVDCNICCMCCWFSTDRNPIPIQPSQPIKVFSVFT